MKKLQGRILSSSIDASLNNIVFVLPMLTYIKCWPPREAEDSRKARGPASMRTFKQSEKSQKTVKSMIEVKGGDKAKEPGGKKNKNTKKEGECCWRWRF